MVIKPAPFRDKASTFWQEHPRISRLTRALRQARIRADDLSAAASKETKRVDDHRVTCEVKLSSTTNLRTLDPETDGRHRFNRYALAEHGVPTPSRFTVHTHILSGRAVLNRFLARQGN